ncbi:MAG: hypothetical protein JNN04_13295 [Cyclobacteriaceae bacterium]|nr:hypothetical protein [Cyclobacteriaceae bacterium]
MPPDLTRNILTALLAENRPEAMVNAVRVAGSALTYEQVFQAVMEMENRNYIKLVYCQFPAVINVQLTLVGKDAADKLSTP